MLASIRNVKFKMHVYYGMTLCLQSQRQSIANDELAQAISARASSSDQFSASNSV